MRDIYFDYVSQGDSRPTVVGVTGPAGHARIVLYQNSMKCGRVLPLGGDIRVAEHTLVIHRGRLPESHMACGTSAA